MAKPRGKTVGARGKVVKSLLALSRAATLLTGGRTLDTSAANKSSGWPPFMSLVTAGESLVLTSW